MVCGLGYRHFSTRTPNRFLSAGGKMWIVGPRRPVRCNAPDSFAGQALRIGGALLIGAGDGSAAREALKRGAACYSGKWYGGPGRNSSDRAGVATAQTHRFS